MVAENIHRQIEPIGDFQVETEVLLGGDFPCQVLRTHELYEYAVSLVCPHISEIDAVTACYRGDIREACSAADAVVADLAP